MTIESACGMAVLLRAVAACGGGGTFAAATSYPLVTPSVGSRALSNARIVDNSNNTIAESVQLSA